MERSEPLYESGLDTAIVTQEPLDGKGRDAHSESFWILVIILANGMNGRAFPTHGH